MPRESRDSSRRTHAPLRVWAVLCPIVVAALLLACGDDAPESPVLRLDHTSISMVVAERMSASHSMVFFNDGDGVLEISGLTVSPQWVSVEPTALSVQPHGQGTATLTALASSVLAGDYTGRVTVESNDPDHGLLAVELEIRVIEGYPPDVTVSPTLFTLGLGAAESVQVACAVVNGGTTLARITEVVAGCEWVSASPTAVDLPPGARSTITLTVRSATLAAGRHQCTVQVHSTDAHAPRWDVVVDLTVGTAGGVPRTVIAEEFTGTWCPYCPSAMRGVHELRQRVGRDRLGVVVYHLQDSFAILAGQDRASLYGVSGIPDVWFDGTIRSRGGISEGAMDYTSEYNQREALPSPVSMWLSLADYDLADGSGIVDAWCRNAGQSAIDARMMLAVTAVDTAYAWLGYNHLYSTAIALPAGSGGLPLLLEAGQTDMITVPFTTPGVWVTTQRELVAFVQNLATKEIYQGAVLRLP